MHDFKHKGSKLYCEKVPVEKIAQKAGTPVFIYSKNTLLDHYRKLDKAFESIPHLICFSVKTNSNVAVCKTLIDEGAGLDIVSGGELFRAKKAGAKSNKIVFAGVGKTEKEIEDALRSNILFFTVESISELELINKTAKRLRVKAPIALRVNPDIDPKTHKYITTGKKGSKFGLDLGISRKVYAQCKKYPHIKPVGIHLHIGSQITKAEPFVKAIKKVLPLVKELKKSIKTFKYFDLGGGLGIVYDKEKPTTAKNFAKAILPLIKGLNLTLVLEPGRFIAGNAGILTAKVLYLKQSGKKNFVIIDGAMNDLIRPSFYEAYHNILSVTKKTGKTISADIVGPICESGDFLALNRKIKKPKQGDLLAVMSAGAYGFSMSSNYNSRPRAAEVLVDKNRFKIIKQRETYNDLIRNESLNAPSLKP